MRTSCMSSIPSCLTAEGGSVSACVLATARSGCGQCDSAPILKVAVRVGAVIRHRSGVLPPTSRRAQTERGRRIRRKKRTPDSLARLSERSFAMFAREVKPTTSNGWRRAQPNRLVVQPPCGRVRQELRSIFRTAATRCTLAAGAQPCYLPLAVSRSRRTHLSRALRATSAQAVRVIDFFREWDQMEDMHSPSIAVTKKEFRVAMPLLGLKGFPIKVRLGLSGKG